MSLTNEELKWATILALTEPPQRCKPKEEPTVVPYLTFYSPNGEFTLGVLNRQKNWDGALEWSTDLETWTEWTGASALSSINGYLYIRGIGNSVISGSGFSKRWGFNGSDIACIGNIETILDYQSVLNDIHPVMSNNCYSRLFQDCIALTEAPDLSAEHLTDWCYSGMFSGCTGLVKPPKILAKTAAEYCCDSMFYHCTNLTVAPELPATTLAYACYNGMFSSCTSLVSAPKLPATTLSTMCYNGMFQACTSLVVMPKLPATTLAQYCYRGMFRLCSSLKISENKVNSFIHDYRIPISGSGTALQDSLTDMFSHTGGPFTGTPTINTTYYTDHEPV